MLHSLRSLRLGGVGVALAIAALFTSPGYSYTVAPNSMKTTVGAALGGPAGSATATATGNIRCDAIEQLAGFATVNVEIVDIDTLPNFFWADLLCTGLSVTVPCSPESPTGAYMATCTLSCKLVNILLPPFIDFHVAGPAGESGERCADVAHRLTDFAFGSTPYSPAVLAGCAPPVAAPFSATAPSEQEEEVCQVCGKCAEEEVTGDHPAPTEEALIIFDGQAKRLGTGAAKVAVKGEFFFFGNLGDLSHSAVTIHDVLNEAGVQLVGDGRLPVTLSADDGSKATKATFATSDAQLPKFKMAIKYKGKGLYSFKLTAEFADSTLPALCGGHDRTTSVTTSFVLAGPNDQVAVTATPVWECRKDDHELRVAEP